MKLTDLPPAFLRAWRDKLLTRYAPGTVRRSLAALGAPLAVAVRDYDWLATNPMKKVLKPPETPGRVRFLSEDELGKLLVACQRSRNPHLHTIVLLALSTGARKTQLRYVRWRDLDVTLGSVRLGVSKRTPTRRLP
jgi:integrase